MNLDNNKLKCVKPLDEFSIGTFDCIVVITDHSEVDYKIVAKYGKLIIDSRNVFQGYSMDNILRLGEGK